MILVYTESENGKFKKSASELVSYAKKLGEINSQKVIVLAVNCQDWDTLSLYGADTILEVKNEKLNHFSAKAFAYILKQIAVQYKVQTIIVGNSHNSKYIAPILAMDWDASYLSNVISLPEEGKFQKIIFSSKATATLQGTKEKTIIGVSANSFGLIENPVTSEVIPYDVPLSDDFFNIKVKKQEKINTKVSIADASIVVSGGRGLKSPDNWHIIEDLAQVLQAATACTKPVSDMGWRPHSEHVGQTGKPVACDLYIAVGISGAIQHLAGVNSSKVKVVINSDPEAPFFKAADYGIVGDAFEIVPKLTEKLKNLPN